MKQNTSSEADHFFNAQEIQRVSEIHNFVAVFTRALQLPLSRTWWGQPATSQVVTHLSKMQLIFSSHICLYIFSFQ